MIDHDDLILKAIREVRHVLRLERIHQELEDESMSAQVSEALPPHGIVENAGFGPAFDRIGVPTDDLADADDALEPGERLDRGGRLGRLER
jgi:hypothetical protein